MTTSCKFLSKSRAFSLVELLVAISVIAIIAGVGISMVGNVTSSARDAAISAQEAQLNSAYLTLKAVTTNMPSVKEDILALLASHSLVAYLPPETMDGPDGEMTLSFNSSAGRFAYVATSGDPDPGPITAGSSSWNPTPANTTSSAGDFNRDNYTQWNEGIDLPSDGMYFQSNGIPGGAAYDPFHLSVNGNNELVGRTQSGETINMGQLRSGDHTMNDSNGFAARIRFANLGGSLKVYGLAGSP